ncbi:MAG: LLM class flavin-dependent oxidoreductase [Alphaproteobacteria bacterium]|nr:LLM class flavin-dependent oxidoreductase [Alphaproteobacteria bacterium]
MKFGLMTQIQMPRPWTPDAEVHAYRNAIDQVVAAEGAGFSHFWVTEQHFFREIGHSPCPDMILAAVSQRTKTIRLGFAVLVMTIHNPYNAYERVASLDVLSNGRVELGLGRGSTHYMVEPFHVDRATERELAAEATDAMMKMFEHEKFPGYHGKFFDLAERYVTPRSVQKPHPPLWSAASNLSSYERIARQGMGVIGVTRNSVSETKETIRQYRETIRSADPAGFVGKFANEQVGAFALACCSEDDRLGRDVACAATRWYHGDNEAELNPKRFATAGGIEAVVKMFRSRTNDELITDGMAIGGNPDTVSRAVEKWADAGLDQMIFILQAGLTTHDQIMRSIELIGEKVIPRFADRA